MKQATAITRLTEWDLRGKYVYTLRDMSKIFPEDDHSTLFAGINRLEKNGFLVRALRGVYVFPTARSRDGHLLEEIGTAFRRGEISYVSLESALSEYGAISQIPVDRITVMTTGRKGVYQTPYGVLDFTHTARSYAQILDGTVELGRPFRFAKLETAWRDLKRVGRNTFLVDFDGLEDDQEF